MTEKYQVPFEDFQEEEEDQLLQSYQLNDNQKSHFGLFVCIVILICFISFLIIFMIAQSLLERPSITIKPYQNAIPTYNNHAINKIKSKFQHIPLQQLQKHLSTISLKKYQIQSLIEIQQKYQSLRSYQSIIRQLNYNNSNILLSKYYDQIINQQYSSITYYDFLQALSNLRLTSFSINDQSNQIKRIKDKSKYDYLDKYGTSKNKQLSISIIVILTKDSMRLNRYYFTFKSIFQQIYNNYKVFVINLVEQNLERQYIIKLLSSITNNKQTVYLDFSSKGGFNIGAAVYTVLHQYCMDSDITVLLRDHGELIGQYAFDTINEYQLKHKPPILFTNYILKSENIFTISQDSFAYKLQLYPKQLNNPRNIPYKSKYLKIYNTTLLLSLPQSVFQTIQGEWKIDKLQAALQFSALEVSCGQYYLLEQILYAASIYDIQKSYQIQDVQKHEQLECMQIFHPQTKSNTKIQKQPKSLEIIQQIAYNDQQYEQSIFLKQNKQIFSEQQILRFDLNVREGIQKRRKMIKNEQTKFTKDGILTNQTKQIILTLKQLQSQINFQYYFSQLKNKTVNKETQNQDNYTEYALKIKESYIKNLSSLIDKKIVQQFINTPYYFTDQINSYCVIMINNNGFEDAQYLYTLQSIMKQRYSNYRLIIYDNKSADLSPEAIKYHLSLISQKKKSKVTFINGLKYKQKSQIVYEMNKNYCKQQDIVFIMQNGDELIDQYVMRKINHDFIQKKVFLIQNQHLIIDKERNSDILQFTIGNSYKFIKGCLLNKLSLQLYQNPNGLWLNKNIFQYLFAKSIIELACKNIFRKQALLVKTQRILAPNKDQLVYILNRKRYDCLTKYEQP